MSKWISVKERLPTHKELVIVYVEAPCKMNFFISYYNHKRKEWEELSYHSCDEGCIEGELITSWMPLPKQPKDDDE